MHKLSIDYLEKYVEGNERFKDYRKILLSERTSYGIYCDVGLITKLVKLAIFLNIYLMFKIVKGN